MNAIASLVRTRHWRTGDEWLLAAIGDGLSPKSLSTRFLAGTPTLPSGYLRYVASAPRSRWDAVVGLHGGAIVGWAEFGRVEEGATEAELAVTVVDAWQGQGLGTMLARRAVNRAWTSGVTSLYAEVLADNIASNRLIRSVTDGRYDVISQGETLLYTMPLMAPVIPLPEQRRAPGAFDMGLNGWLSASVAD